MGLMRDIMLEDLAIAHDVNEGGELLSYRPYKDAPVSEWVVDLKAAVKRMERRVIGDDLRVAGIRIRVAHDQLESIDDGAGQFLISYDGKADPTWRTIDDVAGGTAVWVIEMR